MAGFFNVSAATAQVVLSSYILANTKRTNENDLFVHIGFLAAAGLYVIAALIPKFSAARATFIPYFLALLMIVISSVYTLTITTENEQVLDASRIGTGVGGGLFIISLGVMYALTRK